MSLELLGLLALMGIVGALGFHFGYRAAQSYLPAARAVSEVANAATAQANNFGAMMDGVRSEVASLANAVQASTKANAQHQGAVEASLIQLFEGLERAGLARSPQARARQHGEVSTGD